MIAFGASSVSVTETGTLFDPMTAYMDKISHFDLAEVAGAP
jgi:hypothetical protein